jgi:hypothetical protein
MGERSLPEVAKATAADVTKLVKLELKLATEGLKGTLKKKGLGAAAGAGGGVLLLFGFVFLLASAAAGLAIVLPWWAALLIVGGALVLLAAVMFVFAATRLRSETVPPETKKQIQEDVEWLRTQSS